MRKFREPIKLVGAGALVVMLSGCSPAPVPPEVPLSLLDRTQAELIAEGRGGVVSSPQSAEAWGKLGQIFDASDFHKEARVCYARAAELDTRSAKWLHLLGLLQLQDQAEAGLANLGRAAELAGNQTDAPRLRLAQALIERGRYDEALSHLEKLLAADPGHAAARLEMGRVHLAHNELARSAQSLALCLTNAYTARPALLLMAQIHQHQGEADRAAALARQAGRMPRQFDWPDPFLQETQQFRVDRQKLQDQINGLLMANRLQEAEVALGKLLSTFPKDPDGLLLLGRFHYKKRNYAEAEAALGRHLALKPDSLNGLTQLALVLLNQQQWDEAVAVLKRSVAIKPDFAQAYYNLGYALSRMGDGPGAIRSYREALRCRPGEVATHVALAEELFRAGRDAEARQHVARSLALEPDHPKARRLRELFPPQP